MPIRTTPLSLALSLALAACGGVPDTSSDSGLNESALTSSNGLSTNGLSTNGMSTNGLSTNGLSTNGLSTNGLSTNGFSSWFTGQAAGTSFTNMVMTYVVRCAMSPSQSLTYTSGGVTYTWTGSLGLAPIWSSGHPITVVEQQLITACLAAHANKYGVSVPIAVEGRTSAGTKLTVGSGELTAFSKPEAAFFGNLFTNEGIFVCRDHTDYVNNAAKSSPRACAFDQQTVGPSTVCPPLYHVGQCSAFCVKNPGGPQYDSCTYNGVTYTTPLATRIRPEDIYTCGDGVCQFTEHCGTGTTPDDCQTDCGKCN